MDEHIFQAALAGLLQGLDKLAQRAGDGPAPPWEALVPGRWAAVRGTLAEQEAPATHLAWVLGLARRLSVGADPDPGGDHPGQLTTIFCDLSLKDEGPPPSDAYLPLKPLAIEPQDPAAKSPIFPGAAASQAEIDQAYRALWLGEPGGDPGFKAQAIALRQIHEAGQTNEAAYLTSMLKLLERYAWSVPAATYNGRANISLYDQSRMTAALTACLVKRPEAEIKAMVHNPSGETVALLVGGDISGVQDFIYTISPRGATGALRGRSLYLQLLTDVVARYLLTEVDLPLTNLIYAGGGHFYLLAPASAEVSAKLQKLRAVISQILLHHHQGDLYLAVAAAPLTTGQFQGSALSRQWKAVGEKLNQQKQRRFAELGADMADLLFEPLEHGGNQELQCSVCHREHPKTKLIHEVRKCPVCQGFEALGDSLRTANYLVLDTINQTEVPAKGTPPESWEAVLAHFGYQFELCQPVPDSKANLSYREVLALKDEGLSALQPGPNQAIGRRFLVNVTPKLSLEEYQALKDKLADLPDRVNRDNPPVKPFEVLAYQSKGIKRLGILRMDVDNLGKIFSTGLGDGANLARIANLSFSMSLFFEGWVEQIAEAFNRQGAEENDGARKDLIYSIYSGGDDLFFVGAWHLMPPLAEEISHDLQRYAAEHPGLHLSGGIVLAASKYPLYQAAEDAHQAEQAAKSVRPDGRAKNALNFLGQTMPWPRYRAIKAKKDELVGLIEPAGDQKGAPKSLIRRLVQLYAEYEEARQKWAREKGTTGQAGQAQVYWGPGQWHSAYSLTRLAAQAGRFNQDLKVKIEQIRDDLQMENFGNIAWVGQAARWAELLLRTSERGD